MAELLNEIVNEFSKTEFILEFVQGAILIAILVFVLPRFLKPKLAARRQRIVEDLEAAKTAGAERTRCESEAKRIVVQARRAAKSSIEAGKAEAEAERGEALNGAQQEAAETIARARDAIESEKGTVVSQVCDQMVGLVTVIARRYLDEALTEGERSALTEKLVLNSLEGIDRLAVE